MNNIKGRLQIALIIILLGTQFSFIPAPLAIENYLQGFEYDWDREYTCVAHEISKTMTSKRGVCLDFSYLTAYLLDMHGFQPYEITYHITETDTHAITVFKWRGRWYAFSNMNLWGGYNTFDEVFESRGSFMINGITRNYCLMH